MASNCPLALGVSRAPSEPPFPAAKWASEPAALLLGYMRGRWPRPALGSGRAALGIFWLMAPSQEQSLGTFSLSTMPCFAVDDR